MKISPKYLRKVILEEMKAILEGEDDPFSRTSDSKFIRRYTGDEITREFTPEEAEANRQLGMSTVYNVRKDDIHDVIREIDHAQKKLKINFDKGMLMLIAANRKLKNLFNIELNSKD